MSCSHIVKYCVKELTQILIDSNLDLNRTQKFLYLVSGEPWYRVPAGDRAASNLDRSLLKNLLGVSLDENF